MANLIPRQIFDQHVAILGKTGSGKTYAAKGLVEQMLAEKRQVCVLDPTAAWWGLRLGADGKKKGYGVVLLGGKHADIGLNERSGAAVARLVTQQRASVVIDTSGMTVGEYTRWFIDFAGTLYTTVEAPLHLVIDEAHYFMPQGKAPDPQAGRMIHAGNRLMSGGRSLGIRGMMITQRPAKLHKDSLTCADTMIAMRVIAPQDRKAIKDWIDGAGDSILGAKVLSSLAGLNRGEGWAWYPEGDYLERVKFPKIRTYDSSATPKHGAKSTVAVGTINLAEVEKALAEAVAEAKANDPVELKKEIARLKHEASGKVPAVGEKAVERAVTQAVADRDKHWQGEVAKVTKAHGSVVGRLRKIAEIASVNGEATVSVTKPAYVAVNPVYKHRPAAMSPTAKKQQVAQVRAGESLPRGEAKVLAALIQFPDGLAREQLTVLTGYKRSSRDAYVQRLREKNYVNTDGQNIVATPDGIAALPDAEPLPTGAALQDYWRQRLPTGEQAILAVLIEQHPESVPRDELSDTTGYKRSSRDAYLQRLKAKQLVVFDRGAVRATDNLF